MPTLLTDLALTFRRAIPLLLVVGAIHVAAVALLPRDLEGLAFWALLPIVNYLLYRIALFDQRAPDLARSGAPPPPKGAPLLFLFALALPFLVAGTVTGLLLLIGVPARETGQNLVTIGIYGVFWIALSVFGTMLPAAAAGRPLSPIAALRAAKGKWTGVAIQVFLVAGVLGVAILMAMATGQSWLDGLQAAPPFHYTVDTLMTALGWASLVPTVVILTRADRQSWPQAPGG